VEDESQFSEFEKKRHLKLKVTNAIKKFNFKPKTGLKMLLELEVIEKDNAKSLAVFIYKNHENFSKGQLGEFFGDETPFNIQV
jgi:brefeldin A-inhibited guanine nucleotide-exchange protein